MEVKITISDGAGAATRQLDVSGVPGVTKGGDFAATTAAGVGAVGDISAGAAPAAFAAAGHHGPVPGAASDTAPQSSAPSDAMELSAGSAPAL